MKNILTLILIATASLAFAQSKKAYKKEICEYRKNYKADFLKGERSPIKTKKGLKYLKFYKANKEYKLTCQFERTAKAESFDMPTYSGITKKFVQYGIASFEWEGKTYQLAIYQNLLLRRMGEKYKDNLFLPFKDLTNGETTYGGGRYINLKVSDIENGTIVIDFNKCYNPWCAFSDGFNCPIPPKENHLDLAIEAGEKKYAKKH